MIICSWKNNDLSSTGRGRKLKHKEIYILYIEYILH